MSTPQAKRRRLNEATVTLHKPFKSPFRTPLKPNLGSDPPSSDPAEIYNDPVSAGPDNGVAQEHPVSYQIVLDRPTSSVAKPLLPRSSFSTPTRLRLPQRKSKSLKLSLTREIIDLRNDIQILSQAQALATSSQDSDLLVLIERWRTASRSAAEELFATTRDRVNRMGGVGAWKDREREQKEWKLKAEREEMDAERARLEEAREKGEINEEVYDQYMDADGGAEPEVKETFRAADDDVSCAQKLVECH